MEILTSPVSKEYIRTLAQNIYGDMIKAVADIDNNLLAVDAELHSDLEGLMIRNGSKQENLWGFNIYPEAEGEDYLEFDSLINIRPRQNNRSREVEDSTVREQIRKIINQIIQ